MEILNMPTRNEVLHDKEFTGFLCPHCNCNISIFQCPQCQREIAYDEKCTQLNCPCGISMNIEPCPNCQGKIIYDTRYDTRFTDFDTDFDCPICGVKLNVSNNKLIVSKSGTSYGGTIIA